MKVESSTEEYCIAKNTVPDVQGPLTKRAKFHVNALSFDQRILDMIPDMIEDEKFHMNVRWSLKMLEKSVRLDEKPLIQNCI
nr:13861_t:CDS:2 [Entrophospora candida]